MEDIDKLQPKNNDTDSPEAFDDGLRAQQEAHNAELSKAREIAEAQDPYETVIANVKKMVAKGGMKQKAADRLIEQHAKLSERAANQVTEEQESAKAYNERYEEETEVAAGELALRLTESLATKSSQSSIEIDDRMFKGPDDLLRKHSTVSKEDILKKSLEILDIKSEQVPEVLAGIRNGAKNMSGPTPEESALEAHGLDSFRDTTSSLSASRVETPKGLLTFHYERATYGYEDGSSTPSRLYIISDPGYTSMLDPAHWPASTETTAPNPVASSDVDEMQY